MTLSAAAALALLVPLACSGGSTAAPPPAAAPNSSTAGTSPAGGGASGTPSPATTTATAPGSATASPSAAAPGRYVVLGDSISYGLGLANAGRTAQGVLPAGQGPSVRAWPSLLADGLDGLRPLRVRPTACGLTAGGARPYDQLAVSGAVSVRTAASGSDASCTTPAGTALPTRAVLPDELAAARLRADPPALVTIQIGGNDIDFAGCLAGLLDLPAALGAVSCVTGDAPVAMRATPRTRAALASLAGALTRIIRAVHTDAPHARVVVVDYFQIAPAAAAPVTASSLLCQVVSSQTPAARALLRQRADVLQRLLNATITAAAHRYPDVALVDLTGAFAGHELCTTGSWLFADPWDAAHPTAVGQQHIAAAVLAVCRALPGRCDGR